MTSGGRPGRGLGYALLKEFCKKKGIKNKTLINTLAWSIILFPLVPGSIALYKNDNYQPSNKRIEKQQNLYRQDFQKYGTNKDYVIDSTEFIYRK